MKDGFNGGSDNQLRVNDDGSINVNSTGSGGGNASVGPVLQPAPTSATEIAGVDPDGKLRPVSVDENGFVNVQGVSAVTGSVQQEGLNSFQTSQYNVGNTPVQLAPTALPNRSSLSISIEAGPNIPVYIGNSSSVSTTNGYPLYDGSSLQLDLTPSGQVWAVAAVASGPIACVLEIA